MLLPIPLANPEAVPEAREAVHEKVVPVTAPERVIDVEFPEQSV